MVVLSLSKATRHGDLGNRTAQALPRLRTSHATSPNTRPSQLELGQAQHSILHSCKHYVNLTNVSCGDHMPALSTFVSLPHGGTNGAQLRLQGIEAIPMLEQLGLPFR